jgi:hypothetical protein
MTLLIDTSDLEMVLKSTAEYCAGFIAGGEDGLPVLLTKMGQVITEAMGLWMDAMAGGNHAALHHVYEWYQTGSAGARLFEYDFTVGGNTIIITGETQSSSSIPNGSRVPFYNKADVMESGQSVTISPVNVNYLHWDDVFTPNDVFVAHPGGPATVGSWARYSNKFFTEYLSQSLLIAMLADLATADEFAASFPAGARGGGFGTGFSAGYKWITSPDVGVVV